MQPPETIRDLIDLWPTRRYLAADVTTTVDRVHKWAAKNNIPSRYHQSVLLAARRRQFPVDAERLIRLHAPAETGATSEDAA